MCGEETPSSRLMRAHRETGLRLTEKALEPRSGGDMTTMTDDESQEHRKPKSIDDDLRRVLPMHLTSSRDRGRFSAVVVVRPIHLRGEGSAPGEHECVCVCLYIFITIQVRKLCTYYGQSKINNKVKQRIF